MNINWLADFNFLANLQGGAEMSDREAYLYGLKKGYNMQLINPQSANAFDPGTTDLTVISNATGFNPEWLMKVICSKPYILYLHDYFPLCDFRLFYPMQPKCKKCKNIEPVKKLMKNSVLNIFLSPLHFDAWCFAIPEVKDHPYHIHPSPVLLDLFTPNPNVKRVPNAGLVVNAAAFKGAKNTIAYCKNHPEIIWTFAGGQPPEALSPNCRLLGYVPTLKMPNLFNQASYYLELPDTPQPYNRTFLEARLMEVPNIIGNKNIGAMSYDWFNSDTATIRKHISEAVPNWWKKVEEHL